MADYFTARVSDVVGQNELSGLFEEDSYAYELSRIFGEFNIQIPVTMQGGNDPNEYHARVNDAKSVTNKKVILPGGDAPLEPSSLNVVPGMYLVSPVMDNHTQLGGDDDGLIMGRYPPVYSNTKGKRIESVLERYFAYDDDLYQSMWHKCGPAMSGYSYERSDRQILPTTVGVMGSLQYTHNSYEIGRPFTLWTYMVCPLEPNALKNYERKRFVDERLYRKEDACIPVPVPVLPTDAGKKRTAHIQTLYNHAASDPSSFLTPHEYGQKIRAGDEFKFPSWKKTAESVHCHNSITWFSITAMLVKRGLLQIPTDPTQRNAILDAFVDAAVDMPGRFNNEVYNPNTRAFVSNTPANNAVHETHNESLVWLARAVGLIEPLPNRAADCSDISYTVYATSNAEQLKETDREQWRLKNSFPSAVKSISDKTNQGRQTHQRPDFTPVEQAVLRTQTMAIESPTMFNASVMRPTAVTYSDVAFQANSLLTPGAHGNITLH